MHALRSIVALVLLSQALLASAQCTVSSTSGYSVNLNVYAEAIVPSTFPCTYGYNYQVRMRYDITFSGSNIPGEMYTLQGRITCGSTNIFFDLPNNGGSGTVLSSTAWTTMTNCSSATPASLSCNTVDIEIEGPSLSYRSITCNGTPLPVELVAFNAEPTNEAVQLRWTTASEHNNDHFTVERSEDGIDFAPIFRLSGAGNSQVPTDYSYEDASPLDHLTYYRIRQTDFDGTSTFSDVLAVDRNDNAGLLLAPNPLEGDRFSVPTSTLGSRLDLVSNSGKLAYTAKITTNVVEWPELPPGVYQVLITDVARASVRTARLVKQ